MKKIFYFILEIVLLATATSLDALTEWTTLVYVQAKNNLSPFAIKNFSDMATIGSNTQVSMLVQWYQPEQQGIWRYKVEQGKMILEECNHTNTDGNSAQDLIDAMRWAATKYPAQKNALVLWNHGIGILDPVWGHHRVMGERSELFEIDEYIRNQSSRIQIDGLTIDSTVTFTKPLECSLTKNTAGRGILFNEQSKTYMNNQSLVQALSNIKSQVLKNKNIDLLGMDACLMAMVEVGYLAHKYANVLVASQEVELAHGWPYAILMNLLTTKNISADLVAQGIVNGYQAYYKDKIQFYTQSAINLTLMPQLKDNINRIVTALRAYKQHESAACVELIKKARASCLQFSASHYIDLHTFYADLYKQLTTTPSKKSSATIALNTLKTELNNGMRMIERVVIANASGKNLTRAKGLSIYFPVSRIDNSYQQTEFAKDCLWFEFIREIYRI